MKIKKWSSQWTQFMQLPKEAWNKFRTSTGFEPVTSRLPVWCSTNWAMKPLTLGAGQLWVHMFPWKKWVLMIYEINHVWTGEMNCTGNREVTSSNPVEVLIFFSGFFSRLHKLSSLRRSFLHFHSFPLTAASVIFLKISKASFQSLGGANLSSFITYWKDSW